MLISYGLFLQIAVMDKKVMVDDMHAEFLSRSSLFFLVPHMISQSLLVFLSAELLQIHMYVRRIIMAGA